MPPTISDLTELAYALSDIFGIDNDLEVERAAHLLDLVEKLSINRNKVIEVSPEAFAQGWNLSRNIFFGPTPVVPLEESLYKPWTTSEDHPLKCATGLAWGDPAIHIQETLSSFGMDLDPAMSSSPDHLSVILEFVGFLLEAERFDVVAPFSKDHLDWLDLVLKRVVDRHPTKGAREPIDTVIALRDILISLN